MPDRKKRPAKGRTNLTPAVTFVDDEQAVELNDSDTEPIDTSAVSVPDELPILPLRGLVVYPQTAIPLTIGQPRSVRLVDEVVTGDRLIALVAAKDPELEMPGPDEIYTIGTLASIHRLFRAPDGTIRLLVQGLTRIRVDSYVSTEPYLPAKIFPAPEAVEIEEFRLKIEAAHMPDEARHEAQRELERLSRLPTAAAEYGVIRTYLDWLVNLPWSKLTHDNLDIPHARKVLDEDHYGLKDIKERIIEFLAVRRLRAERKADGTTGRVRRDYMRREREGAILCFVGPPGVGKTSLGASIARAMDRKFIRMSLGGIRDEAEIRGFRRTYIGAMPGRVIQTLRRVESGNPIIMLDEIDKLGRDFRGDPASALLEVLDPEQNNEFRDHYLDVAFNLSDVLFITTANELDPIPGPLRDRMEIIHLSGYTEQEKVQIAKRYLAPRQVRENGLRGSEIQFTEESWRLLIRDYTREAGVRSLEREIGSIARKIVTKVAEGHTQRTRITPAAVRKMLGHPRFGYHEEISERTDLPGVATGLSVTSVGGDVLFVEATQMPGSKGFQYTGQLGEVMQESARAAFSYIRSQAGAFNLSEDYFEKHDIHLHVPAGAVPKDGPSAGVTMATALASLLSKRPVPSNVAMTGEITLRGQVLPVGGIKDKVLAAHRLGVDTVILPKRNEPDLEDVPLEVRQAMKFILAERVDDVLRAALLPVVAIKKNSTKHGEKHA